MTRSLAALRRNLSELLYLVVDAAPAAIVSGDRYLAIRRALSRTPERFTPPDDRSRPRQGEWLARKIACPGIDLVIEGFPGSANSYVSNSLRAALPQQVRIASHFHYTVQIKRALALSLPTLVLVRDPRGACSSYKSKEPELWGWLILWRWLRYHRYVLRQVHRLDVIFFDEVTADLSVVTRRNAYLSELLENRPIEGDGSLRRQSARQLPISAGGPFKARLHHRAERLYARLRRQVHSGDSGQQAGR